MIIEHDLHLHTNLSLCAKPEATLEMYAEKRKSDRIKENGNNKPYVGSYHI